MYWSRLFLALLLAAGISACSGSKAQNPVGSGEESGDSSDSYASTEDKPLTYIAKEGDTLKKIAGRPEIYADPTLWPILQEANADKLGQGTRVNPGTELMIPRDLTTEQIEEAKEKARQAAAAGKVRSPAKKRVPIEQVEAESKPKVTEEQPAPTPVPAASVPKAKKGGMLMPVLLVLLLILAALAVVLYFFMKKDNQENPQD